jgi:hypothetical protein
MPREQPVVREQLRPGEPVEHPHTVGQHAEQPLRPCRVGPYVVPENPGLPEVGPQEADGHRQRRGLARAVRAEQAVERAGWDVEVQARDGDRGVEPLDQPAQ